MTHGNQIRKVEQLLQRPEGCTMMELIECCKTTTPSRRIRDLRDKDWIITKHKVEGKNYHRFFGNPPGKAPVQKPVQPIAAPVKTEWRPTNSWHPVDDYYP
jgi:hypothetical protein